jgi:hypothetical protein
MLVHVLDDGMQLPGARLVQHVNDFFPPLFFRNLSHETPPCLFQVCTGSASILLSSLIYILVISELFVNRFRPSPLSFILSF